MAAKPELEEKVDADTQQIFETFKNLSAEDQKEFIVRSVASAKEKDDLVFMKKVLDMAAEHGPRHFEMVKRGLLVFCKAQIADAKSQPKFEFPQPSIDPMIVPSPEEYVEAMMSSTNGTKDIIRHVKSGPIRRLQSKTTKGEADAIVRSFLISQRRPIGMTMCGIEDLPSYEESKPKIDDSPYSRLLTLRVQADDPDLKSIKITRAFNIHSFVHVKELIDALKTNTHVTSLKFDNVEYCTNVLRLVTMLQTQKSITYLSFTSCELRARCLKHILQQLEGNTTLHSLILSSNDINGSKLATVCHFLESTDCHLKFIDLSKNNITNEDLKPLFLSLDKNNSLVSVHLEDNCFTDVSLVQQIEDFYDTHCFIERQRETRKVMRIHAKFQYTSRTQGVLFHF